MSIPPPYRNARYFVKLHSSCDACGAAKVRCSKEHPECDRCISMDIGCIYSPSQKISKAAKRRMMDFSGDGFKRPRTSACNYISEWTASPEIRVETQIRSENESNEAFTQSWTRDELCRSSFSNLEMDCRSLLYSEPVVDSLAFLPNEDSIVLPTPSTNNVEHLETQLRPLDKTNGLDFCFPYGIDLQDFPYATYMDSLRTPQISTPASTPTNGEFCQLPVPTSKDGYRTHNCHQRAYATLESLHASSRTSSSRVFTPNDTPVQALDNVLSSNRMAINEVLALLDCPCSQDPHLAMLYGSITSQILTGYQIAAGYKKPLSWELDTESATTINSYRIPCPNSGLMQLKEEQFVQSVEFTVAPMKITIGTFSIDEKDQEYFTKQLLLRELKKSSQLIDVLSGHGTHGGDAVDHLYSSLGAWLKSELVKTIRFLENRSGE